VKDRDELKKELNRLKDAIEIKQKKDQALNSNN
jgi:hypothetical protein